MDIRALSVKLLKAHKLVGLGSQQVKDPQTGVVITTIRFSRRNIKQDPKAFFDALNAEGLQYKKLSKDPNALEMECQLWARGDKKKVTQMRERARDEERKKEKGTDYPAGGMAASNYLGPPKPNSTSNLVMAKDNTREMLESAASSFLKEGDAETAIELIRLAGEQDWSEFSSRVSDALRDASIYQSPEARCLQDRLVHVLIKAMGTDQKLFQAARSSELSSKIKECLYDNMDLILNTKDIADGIIRRSTSFSAGEGKVASLIGRYREFKATLRDEELKSRVAAVIEALQHDLKSIQGGERVANSKAVSPLSDFVGSRDFDSALTLLLGM